MLKLIFSFFIVFAYSSALQAQVLATIGQKKITKKQFNKKYSELKRNVFNPPSPQLFLEDLIKFEMGVQEAKKQNFHKNPIVLDRFNQEMYKALVEKEIGAKIQKISVSQDEIRQYYRKYPELKTSQILFQFKSNATPKEISMVQKRANEIYKEIKSSKKPFSQLVKLYSEDNISKRTKGDIGYQSKVTLSPIYYDTARALKVGQISKPITSRFGVHIIKLTGIKKFKSANQRQAKAAVFDSKRKIYFDQYFNKLKKKYSIKKNGKEIKKLK